MRQRRTRTPHTPRDERAASEAEIARLFDRHAASVSAYALRRAPAADAADVVGDTFLVAWRRRTEIPDEPATLPWLYGVARKVLANQRRSRDRRSRLHDRLRHEFVAFEWQVERVEDADRLARVAASMRRLSEDDAELLRLTAWEGLTPTEIGLVLDLDSAAVRQRLRRARQRLRRELGSGEDVTVQWAVPPRSTDPEERSSAHRLGSAPTPRWSSGGGA